MLASVARPDIARRAISEPARVLQKPTIVSRRRSHQRNTMTVDSIFESTEELVVQTQLAPTVQPALITPEVAMGFLRPNVFENIPARSGSIPQIYDPLSPVSTQSGRAVSPDYGRFSHPSMIVLE